MIMKRRFISILIVMLFIFQLLTAVACRKSSVEEKDYDYVSTVDATDGGAQLEAKANYTAFYKPENGRVGDVMPYYEDGVYYLYYLRDGGGYANHPAFLVSTRDFITYEDHGLILPAGAASSPESMIGTGCVLKHGETYCFFYTGHPQDMSVEPETIRVATSLSPTGGFEKQPEFVISAWDYGYDSDFRDPEVRYNPQTDRFDCIVATRKDGKAVMVKFTFKTDFTDVQCEGIIYTDTYGFNVLECPSVFEINGKWYMTYSAQDLNIGKGGTTADVSNASIARPGSKGSMYYLVADSFDGPYYEPKNPALDTAVYYAGKIGMGEDIVLVGWSAERGNNSDYYFEWGGNLQAHRVLQSPDGSLTLTAPRGYAEYFDQALPMKATDKNLFIEQGDLYDIANEVQEYKLTGRICFDDVTNNELKTFGFAFGLKTDPNTVVRVTYIPSAKKFRAQYGKNMEFASKYVNLEAGVPYNFEIICEGSNYVLYIAGNAFTFKARNTGNQRIAIFADGGDVTFDNLAMFSPSNGEAFSGEFPLKAGESKTFGIEATQNSYGSAALHFHTENAVQVLMEADGKTVYNGTEKGFVNLFKYFDLEKGNRLQVTLTAVKDTTVEGSIDLSASYYVPARSDQATLATQNKGARYEVKTDGYVGFTAIAKLENAVDGKLVVHKNDEIISYINVKQGVNVLSGAIYAQAGDIISTGVDFAYSITNYDATLYAYSGAKGQSNVITHAVDFDYDYDLGVLPSGTAIGDVTARDSFGETQGKNGFVYVYGNAVDEMKPIETFNKNYENVWEYNYVAEATTDVIVKGDWIKTGGNYTTGVAYVAQVKGEHRITINLTNIHGTDFALVQVYHNRKRLAEDICADGWQKDYTFTVNAEIGDNIILSIKNVDDLSLSGTAEMNYHFAVSNGEDGGGSTPPALIEPDTSGMTKVADFEEDFYTDLTNANQWSYGYSTDYIWDTNDFTFNRYDTFSGDAWLSSETDGIEIKSSWIRSENGVGDAAIGYTFNEAGTFRFIMRFGGTDETTRFCARVIVQDSTGGNKSVNFYGDGASRHDWLIDKTNIEVDSGDTVYVILFREGDAGWWHGDFSVEIYK